VGSSAAASRISAVTQPCPRPLRKARDAFFDARRADHARVAEGDHHRALGVARVAALDRDGAQLFRFPVWTA